MEIHGWVLLVGGGGANYNKLLEIDNISGVLLQEIELIPNGNLLNNLSEMIMQDDGVVVSCIRMTEGAVSNPAIYKMDYFGNYMWSTEIPNGENVEQYNDHLVQTQDGGFVCAAVHFEGGPTVGVPDEYNYVYRTWLWKVDANGNFLWDRKYEYLSLDSAYYNVYAYPHDLKATPDGGFIIAGEATATCSNFPDCTEATQQGWLLKVDGCGCLVPGCDPGCIVGVEEIAAEDEIKYFRFGPNPVSDMLNLYIPSLSIPMNELNFSLYDNLGRKVNDFQFKFDDTTYMIDASNLASGEYILLLSQNGQIVQTEKVVKN